jgi:hypothetical protein
MMFALILLYADALPNIAVVWIALVLVAFFSVKTNYCPYARLLNTNPMGG